MQLMKNVNTVRTVLIMKRDTRTIQHIVIQLLLHRLLTDTTTLHIQEDPGNGDNQQQAPE